MSGAWHAVVTRPQPQADGWVAALQQAGVEASALPLIETRANAHGSANAAAVRAVWQRLGDFHALMFVSAAAVAHFFAARPAAEPVANWVDGWRAWATGPGTAAALRAVGVPDWQIDQPLAGAVQFDSEALWARIAGQIERVAQTTSEPKPRRVLIVRGGDAWGQMAGRDWLAQQLQARGVAVEFAVAYTRHAPVWTTDLRHTLLQYGEQSIEQGKAESRVKSPLKRAVWVFSSSEAIENLREGLPKADWRGAVAVATHPRIAQTAAQAGFGRVLASGGSLDAVIASIKSLT
jgi:uroporphyrinogen-III synthase